MKLKQKPPKYGWEQEYDCGLDFVLVPLLRLKTLKQKSDENRF